MNKKYYLMICLVFFMCHFSAIAGQALTVTNKNNSGPGSLRQAILDANPGDTIDFAPSVQGTIFLASQLVLDKNLTINGPGANVLGVAGRSEPTESRVFNLSAGNTTISGLRISRGFSSGAGGGVLVEGGNLTLNNCLIIGNVAESAGGVIVSSGSSLTINNSTITGNISAVEGGGVSNRGGTLIMTNTLIVGNEAPRGGGVAVDNGGTATILNCTITDNGVPTPSVGDVGGLFVGATSAVNLKNTIIAKNIGSPSSVTDVGGIVNSQGDNLIGNTTGGDGFDLDTDLRNIDPKLGGFANNGGATYTVSLLSGSPAINAGNNTGAPATDQRGVARPQGGTVDIGSYESGVNPQAFGKIVFARTVGTDHEIFSMNSDGSNQIQLTSNSARDTQPKWSRDGSKIVFVSDRDGIFLEIYSMNADGSGQTRLTDNSVADEDPVWSPDGTKIAFARSGQIFVMDAVPLAVATRLTSPSFPGIKGKPSWSPDGTQIVFHNNRGFGNFEIDVISSACNNCTGRQQIGDDPPPDNFNPIWSPDSNTIAFSNDQVDFDDHSDPHTFLLSPWLGNLNFPSRPLEPTNNPRLISPAWSPDGTKFVYQTNVNGLSTINADGSSPTILGVDGLLPDWGGLNTPPGTNITVVVGTSSVNFLSVGTSGTTTVVPIDPADAGTLPGGYSLGPGFPAYEITTTATYTAPITVCLQVPSATAPAVFSTLRILHNEGGMLMDRTILPPNTPAPSFPTICARVNSLSPFVVAQSTATPEPTPAIVAGGATLINESCPVNGQIDPGERVTVNLKLMNTGNASTTNLIATLQTGAGVQAPSGPQTFGAIAPAGMVGRDLSFTADPTLTPGQPIVVTLQLQDGPTGNPGTVSFNFIAGSSPCGGIRLVVTSTTLQRTGGTVTTFVTVQNTGTLPAEHVTLTSAMLGSASGTFAPSNLGTINVGASAGAQVSFTTAATGSSLLKFSGTYGPGIGGSGSISSTKRVAIP